MYRVQFRAFTPSPVEIPGLLRVVSRSLRDSQCIVVEKASWVLANCDDVLVKVSLLLTPPRGELIVGFEGSMIITIEGSDSSSIVKMASILVSALEGVGAGVTIEG
ncbi:MAG: hypothetical protein QXO93_00360 [Acidilobaceae archaeon]